MIFFNKKAKQNVINNYVNDDINDSAYGGFRSILYTIYRLVN